VGAIWQARAGWVWPAPTAEGRINHFSLRKQHIKALRLAGVHPFVLYSLRHTFVTRLGASGATHGRWPELQATAR
jgi:integrase